MDLHYRAGEAEAVVKVTREGERLRVEVAGRRHDVIVRRARDGALDLLLDGKPFRACVAAENGRRWVALPGAGPFLLERLDPRQARARPAGAGEDTLIATMHGQVAAVLVKAGDRVERGAQLVILEAMKMELRVTAPHGGRVKAIACKPGDVVERGKVLVELEAAEAATPPPA